MESHSLQLEYGNPDDEYGCLQNKVLRLENDASPDNNFIDDATLSFIKTDDNYSAMAKAAENQNIIEKLLGEMNHHWIIFLWKSKRMRWHPVCGVKCNKTLQVDIK